MPPKDDSDEDFASLEKDEESSSEESSSSESDSDSEEEEKNSDGKETTKLKHDQYDEALDLSESNVSVPNVIKNEPFDEEVVLSESGSMDDSRAFADAGKKTAETGKATAGAKAEAPKKMAKAEDSSADSEEESSSEESSGEDSSDPDSDSNNSGSAPPSNAAPTHTKTGGGERVNAPVLNIDPNLVSDEIRELFQYISRYRPQNIELETTLRPFIPEYIPTLGEIDSFCKIPRPDSKVDGLGVTRVDEPAASQSDATVLDLQLRAGSKSSKKEPALVHAIENAHRNPKEVDRWINNIKELHRSKPLPQVSYKKAMPEIESLMQEWPAEFEELLKTVKVPNCTDMDLSLREYVGVVCATLDIPVYDRVVDSLHVLFTLYSEFKNNQHFMNAAGGGGIGVEGTGAPGGGIIDDYYGAGGEGAGGPDGDGELLFVDQGAKK